MPQALFTNKGLYTCMCINNKVMSMIAIRLMGLCILSTLFCNAHAVKVEGSFSAIKSCPAYKSFKRGHNPGDVHVVPGNKYKVVEENKINGPWALILVPQIDHPRRWVTKECGITEITQRADTGGGNGNTDNACNLGNTHDSYVLALSWQAGFCEHYPYNRSKPKLECDNLNAGNIVVTNITIHGLWPNKSVCGTGFGYCGNEPLNLEDSTISIIAPWMPNFYYSTSFGEHEWNKHGTCQDLADDDYFLLTKRLAEKVDQSALGEYMRNNMGREVDVNGMKSHLNETLGSEVVSKIQLVCTGRGNKYINEFRINLPHQINETEGLEQLTMGAKNVTSFQGNCASQIYIEAPGML